MSIQLNCPECNGELHLNDRMAGRRVRCQHCDAVIKVPRNDQSALVGQLSVGDQANTPDQGTVDSEADDFSQDRIGTGQRPERTAAALAGALADLVAGGADEALEPSGGDRVSFAHDPVFDTPGHHHATDMPTLPPSLQADDSDDDPPKRAKRKEDELDMTPMVDVTFLLLIFFMVTASFSLQKSMAMPRQQSDLPSSAPPEEPPEEPDMVTVQIDEFGSFLVLASDWERETPGKQNLISALREAIAPFGGAVTLSIEVHEEAKLRYLVDCMDAGAICSFAEVKITQVEGFD